MNERCRELSTFLKSGVAITLTIGMLGLSAAKTAESSQSPNSPIPVPTGSTENPNLNLRDTTACLDENNRANFKSQITNSGLRTTSHPFQVAGYVDVSGHSYNEFTSEVDITKSVIPGQTVEVKWKIQEPLTEDTISNHNGWYVVVDSNDRIVEMGQGNYDNTYNDGSRLQKCDPNHDGSNQTLQRRQWLPLAIK